MCCIVKKKMVATRDRQKWKNELDRFLRKKYQDDEMKKKAKRNLMNGRKEAGKHWLKATVQSSRALDFACLHEFCPLTETMDMTELLNTADSSRESLRLEPKWLRVTYKRQSSTDTTKLLEAADSSRASMRLEPKWLRVTSTYLT